MSLPHVTNGGDERRFEFVAATRAIQRGLVGVIAHAHEGIDEGEQKFRLAVSARGLNRFAVFGLGQFFQADAGLLETASPQQDAEPELIVGWPLGAQIFGALTQAFGFGHVT